MKNIHSEDVSNERRHLLKSKKFKIGVPLIVLVILLGVASWFVFKPKPIVSDIPTVEIEDVTTQDVKVYGEYVGRIRAQQFVEVHARVEGYLESMLFKEGSFIKKGETLFIIDPKLYKAHVQ